MEITDEEIYIPNHADAPDLNEEQLPRGISPEAAYILDEATSGRNLSEIADELNVAPNTVSASMKNMKEKGIVEYPEQRRGRDYNPTEDGQTILGALENPNSSSRNQNSSLNNLNRKVVFGNRHYDAKDEIDVLVYSLHEDYTISDLESETDLESEDLMQIRDDLEPLMSKNGKYTVEYEPSLLGIQVLAHLDAIDYWEIKETIDTENEEENKEDEFSWSLE